MSSGLLPLPGLLAPVEIGVDAVLLVALIALAGAVAAGRASLEAADDSLAARASGAGGRRLRWLAARPREGAAALALVATAVHAGAVLVGALLAFELASRTGGHPGLVAAGGAAMLTAALLMAHGAGTRLAGRRATPTLALPVYLLTRLTLPMVRPLARVGPRERPAPAPISAEEVHALADVGEEQGTLGEEEAALIHSLLEFGDTYAIEAMVGRVDIVALHVSATLDEAVALIRESGHSRFPLYDSSLDDILGVVYAKDLLPIAGPDRPSDGAVDWRALARPARFIPPSRTLDDLLDDFRTHKTHIAIVLDEYGGTAGLITLEDLLEEVVGEIRDELDSPEDEAQFASVGVDSYRADAGLDLDDLFERLGMDVDTEDFDFETLGGLVFHLSGLVPDPGDEVTFRGLRLRVERVEENRIREVLITRGPDEDEDEDGAP